MAETLVVNDPLPCFVVPENQVTADGEAAAIALGPLAGKDLLITLGITRVIEQQSLDLSISGSANGTDWEAKPLLAFPQKFYCGTYQMILGLSQRPEISHLRAQWKVNRWGRGTPTPLFDFYVAAETMKAGASGA